MWSGTGLKLGSAERSQRVKMWGTSSPDDKLTGDLGNVIEATQIGGRRSDRLMARKLSQGNFGLLQQYLPRPDSCTAANTPLFDHLVGAAEQRQRHCDAERLGGLEVEDQLHLCSLLDRQICRPLPLE